jgi:5,10-methylenetetrahydromethanopterin reductase
VRIGIQLREPLWSAGTVIDDLIETASEARRCGLSSIWLAQAFEYDALTALAVIGRCVPDIELGTAVVPTYPRHPLALAEQALTVQAACGNRLALGIGPSHKGPIEEMYGYSFAGLARHVEEYLDILLPALASSPLDHSGQALSAHTRVPLHIVGAKPCPVLLGAMGPRMLVLAGAVAGGTVTAKTGPRTLASHIVPSVNDAARQAGRPPPRIAACLPFCLTGDLEGSLERAGAEYRQSEQLPSYQAMLEREGVARAADIALIGDERQLISRIRTLEGTGISDFLARIVGVPEERRRSLELLGSLARGELQNPATE